MFGSSCENVSINFTIISSIAATTRITINTIRTHYIIKSIFNETMYKIFYGDWKTALTQSTQRRRKDVVKTS